jgi:hypothetical protein
MKYILYFLVLMIGSCTKLEEIAYDQFTLYKKIQYSEQVKVNGEYWSYDTLNNIHWFMILYRDGSFHRGGNEVRDSKEDCIMIEPKVRDVGWWWGFYNIENRKMKFEYVDGSSINSNSKYQVVQGDGELINDTTYTEIVFEQPNNVRRVRKYHYMKCTNKPDSMNVILRNIGR